jgi:prepilin-type N-terminal cleavage/methylation domain-containing protein
VSAEGFAVATPRSPRRRGFSLLELLIALAIFSVVLLAMLPLFARASWGLRGSRDLTRATELARTYVDKLRNTPFDSVGLNIPPAVGACDPCTPPAAEVAANAPFVVTWTVAAADGSAYPFGGAPPDPNIKRVTVTVTVACSDCTNGQRRVQMTTLIAQRS